ncbi:class I SAM-dependent methyltransferase [Novosphingobium sp.]|uniref:class I SAM-dependent methyltransferase n=1 Tax=Novosphingobium sp. TaxID=1874826 RepID=UPI00286E90CD|nr:class I SAM-dependent methyltransferase [Novosphingobium sp.]
MTTSYDSVAYPSATFPQTHPDHLALIARLHGLATPAFEQARVLEIGGGDGFNAIALAAVWPGAQFVSFDLSAEAVKRGQALVAASGMANVRVEQGDILDFARDMEPGSFDYIIAHGVYAWVPPVVQQATLDLVGRALSADGLAFISFNAMPGGHVRRVMRDMLLHALQDVEAIEDRIVAARAFLERYAERKDGDDAVVLAMRAQAEAMLGRPDAVLFHDELGECFEPVSLTGISTDAAARGLEFLADAGRNRLRDGFLAEDAPDDADTSTQAILRCAQDDDYAAMRFFRQSIFIREGRSPARRPDLSCLPEFSAAGQFKSDGDGGIKVLGAEFALRDEGLTAWLLALGEGWPRHRPLSELGDDPARFEAIFRLFAMGLIHLSNAPAPFSLTAGERPEASALVRAQIALGSPHVTTLHFEQMALEDEAARGLIAVLDGSRGRSDLEPLWQDLPHVAGLTLDQALELIAAQRLLRG